MGSNGYFARQATDAELEEKTAELKALEETRAALEKDVSLMSPSNLDPDLLDEQARSVLGLAGDKELIIILDDEEQEPTPPED